MKQAFPDSPDSDSTDKAEYTRFKKFKESEQSKPSFSYSAGSGRVLGFSNIPGVTNAKINFGKTKKTVSQQFVKKSDTETPPETPTDQGPAPAPVKPTKGKNATVADVEAAVRKGYVTPDEATGGGVREKWYEAGADGKADLSKPTKVEPMSKNYATKLGKAQAESQATGKPMGKQFTGPKSMKISAGPAAGFHPYAAPVNLDEFNK